MLADIQLLSVYNSVYYIYQ